MPPWCRSADPAGPTRQHIPPQRLTAQRQAACSTLRGISPAPGAPGKMGQGGLEPPTPRLSSVCSNQLSYWPQALASARARGAQQPAKARSRNGRRMRGRRRPQKVGHAARDHPSGQQGWPDAMVNGSGCAGHRTLPPEDRSPSIACGRWVVLFRTDAAEGQAPHPTQVP